jgi:hypothetical protein
MFVIVCILILLEFELLYEKVAYILAGVEVWEGHLTFDQIHNRLFD